MMRPEHNPMKSAPKVVIVGGGPAGVRVARKLRFGFDVTLVDPKDFFVFIPLFDEYSVGTLPPSLVKFNYSKVLRGIRHVKGSASSFDYDHRTVTVQLSGKGKQQSVLHYDYLVIAIGAGPNSFGIKDNIFHIYDIEHADIVMQHMCTIRERIKKGQTVRVAVAGAGPVGMESAGVVEEFIRHYSVKYKNNSKHEVIMFNAGEEILAGFSNKIREMASRAIEARKYMSIDNFCFCQNITKKGDYYILDYEKDKKKYTGIFDLVLWRAGMKKKSINGEKYVADEYLRLKGSTMPYENVFVAGDSAVISYKGMHVPELAQTAVQEANQLARNIRLKAKGLQMKKFEPHFHGTIITIGHMNEIGHIGNNGFVIYGFPAWVLHRLVYLDQMYDLEHKFRYLFKWSQALFRQRYAYLKCSRK